MVEQEREVSTHFSYSESSMKRHIFAIGLVAIATSATVVTVPSASYAAGKGPLSQGASDLLKIDPSSESYLTKYDQVEDIYNSQAKDYSLEFEDWFAINSFVNDESAAYGTDGAKLNDLTALNLEALTWEAGAHGVEAFFINEGAGYWNKFGYSLTNDESMAPYASSNNALKEFWDEEVNTMWSGIASENGIYANGGSMTLGEGYSIGNVSAGDTVSFFLKNQPGNVFDSGTVGNTHNKDGLQHVTTYQYEDFLVLAYEDLYGGGDKDYNDVVIAVRGLVDTTPDVADVPEPATVLALLGLGVVGSAVKRKQAA